MRNIYVHGFPLIGDVDVAMSCGEELDEEELPAP